MKLNARKKIGFFAVAAVAMLMMSFDNDSVEGGIKVTLENNCKGAVEVKILNHGKKQMHTVEGSKSVYLAPGSVIYNSAGKVVHTVDTKTRMQSVTVCD